MEEAKGEEEEVGVEGRKNRDGKWGWVGGGGGVETGRRLRSADAKIQKCKTKDAYPAPSYAKLHTFI